MSSPRPSPPVTAIPTEEPRLHDYLEGERDLLELKCCAPKVLSVLIHDLSRPMSRTLEQALARRLAAGEIPGFWPTDTLMPPMMERFGLTPASFAKDPAIHALRTTCNTCARVGTCWLALRHRASREECRGFCPNAEAFERRAPPAASDESG